MNLVNNYLQIEPVAHEAFITSQRETYDEIGVVVAVAPGINIPVGSKVYFDSFMAKKYPVHGETDKFHWFVALEEIVAYE